MRHLRTVTNDRIATHDRCIYTIVAVTSQRPSGGNIIVKMADCGSDVEFKNEKNCAYDENNWRLTLTTIYLRRFGALRPL